MMTLQLFAHNELGCLFEGKQHNVSILKREKALFYVPLKICYANGLMALVLIITS